MKLFIAFLLVILPFLSKSAYDPAPPRISFVFEKDLKEKVAYISFVDSSYYGSTIYGRTRIVEPNKKEYFFITNEEDVKIKLKLKDSTVIYSPDIKHHTDYSYI